MRVTTLRLVLVGALAALASALVLTGAVGAKDRKRGKATFGALKAKMSGDQEAPGPGDEDGTGKAFVQVLPQYDALCFRLKWRDIADPTAAHIHAGEAGVAGDVVVPLFVTPEEVRDRGCVDGLDDELLRSLKRDPQDFYVNVHNADFPGGAIRGQLRTVRRRGGGGGHKRGR